MIKKYTDFIIFHKIIKNYHDSIEFIKRITDFIRNTSISYKFPSKNGDVIVYLGIRVYLYSEDESLIQKIQVSKEMFEPCILNKIFLVNKKQEFIAEGLNIKVLNTYEFDSNLVFSDICKFVNFMDQEYKCEHRIWQLLYKSLCLKYYGPFKNKYNIPKDIFGSNYEVMHIKFVNNELLKNIKLF